MTWAGFITAAGLVSIGYWYGKYSRGFKFGSKDRVLYSKGGLTVRQRTVGNTQTVIIEDNQGHGSCQCLGQGPKWALAPTHPGEPPQLGLEHAASCPCPSHSVSPMQAAAVAAASKRI